MLGLPLNMATIIHGCIFLMLLILGPVDRLISLPTSPIVALTEFFHADAETNVHSLLVSSL